MHYQLMSALEAVLKLYYYIIFGARWTWQEKVGTQITCNQINAQNSLIMWTKSILIIMTLQTTYAYHVGSVEDDVPPLTIMVVAAVCTVLVSVTLFTICLLIFARRYMLSTFPLFLRRTSLMYLDELDTPFDAENVLML